MSAHAESGKLDLEQSVTIPNPLDQIESTVRGLLQQIAAAREQAVPCAPPPTPAPLYGVPLPRGRDPRFDPEYLLAYPQFARVWQSWADPLVHVVRLDDQYVPGFHPVHLMHWRDISDHVALNPLSYSPLGEITFVYPEAMLRDRAGGDYSGIVIRTPDGAQYPADAYIADGEDSVFMWHYLPESLRSWFADGVIRLTLCGTGNRCAQDAAGVWNCSAAGQVRACVDTIRNLNVK